MQRTLLATFALLAASSASAQMPRTPAPVQQSATIDIASAFQQRYRAMIEPLVFGRFSVGVSGEYTTEPKASLTEILYPAGGCSVTQLCTQAAPVDLIAPCCGYNYGYGDDEYRAWSFALHGRWYPAAFSLQGERQSVSFFVGEFIGYHERRVSEIVYYGCPYCDATPPPAVDTTMGRPDSLLPPRPTDPYYGGGSRLSRTLKGWEPGAEFGFRVRPTRHVVMDVGGQFRLVRLGDYRSGQQPGDIDKRLLVTVGVGW